MACDIASPTRLMRRNIKNTPTGPALKPNASTATIECRTDSLANGSNTRCDSMALHRLRRHAGLGPLVERLAHLPRLAHVVGGQNIGGRPPGHRLARQQQRLGKVRL